VKVTRRIIARKVIIEKKVRVCARSDNASFFFPSIYIRAGFPKIKNPVIEADITRSKSSTIGARKAFVFPIFIEFP